jgi:hypothetical protein
MAYKQEPGRKPSAFGEVLKSRGLINTISNPKAAKKQASDIRIARLKEELASKPKNPNPTFFTMEAYKPEGTLENPTIRQYYKTERTAGGDFVSRELSLDYTKKQNKIATSGPKSLYRQMREHIKEVKPTFKGRDVSKRKKASWKDKAGGTGGRKNVIKNKYGFGFTPISSDINTESGEGIKGSGNMSTLTGRSQSGVCTQAKMLEGKCN